MVTNHPRSTASEEDGSARAETHAERFGGVLHRLRHMVCALHGHDTLLQFEHGRMFLRCVSCGHETPGSPISVRHGRYYNRRQATIICLRWIYECYIAVRIALSLRVLIAVAALRLA